jgi:DNA modification methylase/superfamily II DNA or RNA helicase
MNYEQFLESKTKSFIESGFDIDESYLNSNLFEFQKYIVKISLKKGRFAIFADCGLGKTLMQLEFANQINKKYNKPVLILAPLAVVEQTIQEGKKFNISINRFDDNIDNKIYITNYDQLKNIDTSLFFGVVLDESSILKGKDGKLSNLLIESFKSTPYKLACTATPSPNDHMELGMHVEFLSYDTYDNMKSMYFIQDQKIKSSDKWRLRKHAEDSFWKFVCTWSISLDNPCSLGYDNDNYKLPDIEYIEHIIPVKNDQNTLFNINAVSATDLNKDLRKSLKNRLEKAAEIVNNSDDQWIIWGLQNAETNELSKIINNSVNVQGSDKSEIKAKNLLGFAKNEFKVLITKTSIASFGMNYQNCHNMLFCSYDFKFEAFYQAVRRCYRFGQKMPVKVHLLIPESQSNVRNSILEKQNKHFEMIKQMSKYSANTNYKKNKTMSITNKEIKTDNYWLINGDCIKEIKKIDNESIDYSFFSPPFADLYTYSDDPKDLSNVRNDDEFYKHFNYLVPELFRILKPGRLISMHIMQGTTSKGKDGFLSIKDFRGELIRLFQKNNFYFHAEKMIRKNPQLAAVRTKNQQLMHGQTKRDSSINRPGLADYVITFRKPGVNKIPIRNNLSFDLWCKLAEPVWMDINESDVISNFRKAKSNNDEKHMTPTQLSVIRNCYLLWSNKGDTIFSPFGGVGSEGCQALKMDRKSINIELKESYFKLNAINHKAFDINKKSVLTLF